jgi:hypothetical protein
MKANDLFEYLKQTGTGPFYLRPFRDVIAAKLIGEHEQPEKLADDVPFLNREIDKLAKKLDADDLLKEVTAATSVMPEGQGYSVTLAKARRIVNAKDVKATIAEINGKPPRQSSDAKEERMASMISDKNAEMLDKILGRQKEAEARGIGDPDKLPGVKKTIPVSGQ